MASGPLANPLRPGHHTSCSDPRHYDRWGPDTVIIWTQSGGCTRKGPTQIISYDTVVTIRLFDSLLVRGPHGPPDYACPLIRSFARRRVEIRFSHPGQGVVRVVGTDTTQHAVVVQ